MTLFIATLLIACGTPSAPAPELPASVEVPPTHAQTPPARCNADSECALNETDRTCSVGAARRGLIEESGGHCTCSDGACQAQWFDPVPCESWRDCDVTREPRLRPVAADPKRTKQVAPCADAEVDAICDKERKVCRVLAWKC